MTRNSAYAADQVRRRIGIVDLNLDDFHSNVYLNVFRTALKNRRFSVVGATAWQAGRERTDKNDVAWYVDVDSPSRNVDVFAIFAPANPE